MKIQHTYCCYDDETVASKQCDTCGTPLCSGCGYVLNEQDYCNSCYAKVCKPYSQLRTKLMSKRFDLRSIDKYTEVVRKKCEQNHGIANCINDPIWNLLIAVECLHRYLKIELNERLKKENINPV